MEFHPSLWLAFPNPLQPVVVALHALLTALVGVFHNYGWSLIALAALVKIVFWPLNTMQFKSMVKTQALAPQVKALQARYKNDREKLNEETMKLYKESGTNPFAGCLPLLVQMPILISLYWAIQSDKAIFAQSTWLWIGSAFSQASPAIFYHKSNHHILATSLAQPDYVLLVLYMISMYLSVRFTSPAMDPQQAQQQKIMAFISPAMIGWFAFNVDWPSALILYLAFVQLVHDGSAVLFDQPLPPQSGGDRSPSRERSDPGESAGGRRGGRRGAAGQDAESQRLVGPAQPAPQEGLAALIAARRIVRSSKCQTRLKAAARARRRATVAGDVPVAARAARRARVGASAAPTGRRRRTLRRRRRRSPKPRSRRARCSRRF